MFLVSDIPAQRRGKIQSFLENDEPAIAVLLAAADCERTIRRAILSLGKTPTRELALRLGRKELNNRNSTAGTQEKATHPYYGSSLKGYNKAWNAEVYPFYKKRLSHDLITNWKPLLDAFDLRHALIHGDKGTTGLRYAERRVNVVLEVTSVVHNFALHRGYDLTAKLRRRIVPRKLE